MKILSPIDSIEEALPLIRAGADEFYCGIQLDGMNLGTKRGKDFSYLKSFEELERLAEILKKHDRGLYLLFNNQDFTKERFEIFKIYSKKLKTIGIKNIIVANPALLSYIKDFGFELVASSYFSVMNHETVSFLKRFNVKSIVLDRQITIADMKDITAKHPNLRFEVISFEGKCFNINMLCDFKSISLGKFKQQHTCFYGSDVFSKIDGQKNEETMFVESKLGNSFGCAACAFFKFNKYGISSLKIVGRGYQLERKISYVTFIYRCLRLLERSISEEEYIREAKQTFHNHFKKPCDSSCCYYPHFIHNGKSYIN